MPILYLIVLKEGKSETHVVRVTAKMRKLNKDKRHNGNELKKKRLAHMEKKGKAFFIFKVHRGYESVMCDRRGKMRQLGEKK